MTGFGSQKSEKEILIREKPHMKEFQSGKNEPFI